MQMQQYSSQVRIIYANYINIYVVFQPLSLFFLLIVCFLKKLPKNNIQLKKNQHKRKRKDYIMQFICILFFEYPCEIEGLIWLLIEFYNFHTHLNPSLSVQYNSDCKMQVAPFLHNRAYPGNFLINHRTVKDITFLKIQTVTFKKKKKKTSSSRPRIN